MEPLHIAVASGKGGTGKTTVAVNLALSLERASYLDCDVEAPNGHLFLNPDIATREPVAIPVPVIDPDRCTLCGDCAEACEFNALAVSKTRVLVFGELCHGCGVCSYVCPEPETITEIDRPIGEVATGSAAAPDGGHLPFVQGTLTVGERSPVPVIKATREQAGGGHTLILDAPPGTACPMVETVRGADYCLLVTEPTPFGLNDLELAVQVVRTLEVPCSLVLNRSDLGDGAVADYCRREGIPILLRIPFERGLAQAYARGVPWVQEQPERRALFRDLYRAIERELGR